PEPVFSGELMRLASWIADYYLCPMGEVVKAMLVRGALSGGKKAGRLSPKFVNVIVVNEEWKSRWKNWLDAMPGGEPSARTERPAAALRILISRETGDCEAGKFLGDHRLSPSVLRTLAKNALVETARREVRRVYGFDYHEASLGAVDVVLN